MGGPLMAALAFSLTPQGVAVVKQGDEPILIEGGSDVALVQAMQSKLTPDVNTLLVCRGPGSFTSVRVVLSFASGVCAARPELSFLSATTFDLLAFESGYPASGWMLVYSHQGYFYAEPWAGANPSGEATRLAEADLPQGSACMTTPCPNPAGRTVITRPQALILIDMFEAGRLTSHSREPYYVHDPVFKTHTAAQNIV